MNFIQLLHNFVIHFSHFATVLFEFIGVSIIFYSGLKGAYAYMIKDRHMLLNLEKGMCVGLGVLCGGEILRTVTAKNVNDIFIIAAIIFVRALLVAVIQWEIKHERHSSSIDDGTV